MTSEQAPITDSTLIEDLRFSVGVYNPLKRYDIHTVGDLTRQKEEDLERVFSGMSSARRKIDEVKDVLRQTDRFLAE